MRHQTREMIKMHSEFQLASVLKKHYLVEMQKYNLLKRIAIRGMCA